MTEFWNFIQPAAFWIGIVAAVLICIAGVVLSCLSLSGTWLVVAATVIAALITGEAFPGLWTVLAFIVLAALVEGTEFVAGAWGVKRRGGSTLAGVAAVAGGVLGFVLGSFIPVPVLGSFVGMIAGSFGLAFAVERHRLEKADEAASIALGAVFARILMILLKVSVTLGMIGYLFMGMLV